MQHTSAATELNRHHHYSNLTRLWSASMRRTLNASASVTASGRPSGTATTCVIECTRTDKLTEWQLHGGQGRAALAAAISGRSSSSGSIREKIKPVHQLVVTEKQQRHCVTRVVNPVMKKRR